MTTVGMASLSPTHTILPNAYCKVYSQSRTLDPDIKSIQCVVGGVEDQGKWSLVDHSGLMAHVVFTETDQSTVT